jgi:lipoprotein-releasing system ATP-binding protein
MKISVQNLSKNYYLHGQEVPVLKNVDFEIPSGEVVTLTGPSGVGKSTLLHVLGTLDNPSVGDVLFDEEPVFNWSGAELAHFRNQKIGFVFQFHHLLPEFDALENVMMPALMLRKSKEEAAEQAESWLKRVGLGHRIQHKPGELSGGEQQRVALARSLVNDPKLLLADEPTGNLDENTGKGIHDLIFSWSQESGGTAFIVTHNSKLAALAQTQLRLTPSGIEGAAVPQT